MNLDIRFVVLFSGLIPLVLGVLMLIYWRTGKTYPGFGLWVAANFAVSIGFTLLGMRGLISDWLTIILGNLLTLYGLALIFTGVRRFFGGEERDYLNFVVLGFYALAQVFLTFGHPDVNARIILVSGLAIFYQLRIAFDLLRLAPPALRQTSRVTALIFLASSLVAALRWVYAALSPVPLDMQGDMTLAAIAFGSTISLTVWSIYFFFLNSARLEMELRETQKNLSAIAAVDQRKILRMRLLDEASRSISQSMEEHEILQRTVQAVINQFGYAEAAISLLVDTDFLEIAAIDGTEDVGYRPGYRQKLGEGIIGHTAAVKEVYVCRDIEHDPYYYTIGQRSGSAVCLPMVNENNLLGVLYVESAVRDAFEPEDIQTLDTLIRHASTAVEKARLYARSQSHLRAISTLQSAAQAILSSLEFQQIFQSVVQLLKDTFQYSYVSIYSLHGSVLHLEAQVGYPTEMIIFEIPAERGIAGRCIQSRQTQFVRDVSKDPAFLRAALDIESEICVPIIKDDHVLGVINVEAEPGQPLSEDDLAVLNALSGPVGVAIENAQLHADVKQLALTDGLTGLYNRRAFDQVLESELARAALINHPVSLIIIDMDSFKEYNDQYGHPAGDERLKSVAEMLRYQLRSPDFVARYGGEEFTIILPNTSKQNALILAERLRSLAASRAPVPPGGGTPAAGYTFSMGLATYPDDSLTAAGLLQLADQAELKAKKQGKNQVCEAGSVAQSAIDSQEIAPSTIVGNAAQPD